MTAPYVGQQLPPHLQPPKKRSKAPIFIGVGVVVLAVVAFLAFGVFGVHTLFTDEKVAEDGPVFDSGAAADTPRREEVDVVTPAIRRARRAGLDVTGPLPADGLFALAARAPPAHAAPLPPPAPGARRAPGRPRRPPRTVRPPTPPP